jgi:hypothetical protein
MLYVSFVSTSPSFACTEKKNAGKLSWHLKPSSTGTGMFVRNISIRKWTYNRGTVVESVAGAEIYSIEIKRWALPYGYS